MLTLIEFVWIWMQIQGLNVPKHHKKMCAFLWDIYTAQSDKNALLMAFRNSGKSTIIGLFCSYILWQNPNTRILILSADHELAKKMVRNIKRIIEKHPMTKNLKPTRKEEWASDRFTITRTADLRDPSVLARGLQANITGSRADLIICDDVEVPKTCDNSSKRKDLRAKLSELDYILTPGGMMVYIGTPHTADTIYNTNDDGFLNGWHQLRIPILNKNGQSNWPERFSNNKIDSIRKHSGQNKFLSQMMLEAVQINDSRLNSDLISFYNDELFYKEANETAQLSIGKNRLISVSCWWDPAFGAKDKGDDSVVACVFTDENGLYYLHDITYLQVPSHEDAATYQCKCVADFIKRNFIPCINLETNGIGKFLPAILKKELAQKHIPCAVLEKTSHQNKSSRILSAFDAILMNRSLKAHTRIKQTPFLEQMKEWSPAGRSKDDSLDAVAGCLLSESIRLPSKTYRYFNAQKEWRF
ncbi:MAG: phage terminase large subunit [Alphaproteobacteria bacterium]|nr:phage terminase large subunit [Alphaproteobacteria bacterium]